jgi:hypothetical protein
MKLRSESFSDLSFLISPELQEKSSKAKQAITIKEIDFNMYFSRLKNPENYTRKFTFHVIPELIFFTGFSALANDTRLKTDVHWKSYSTSRNDLSGFDDFVDHIVN